MELSSVPQGSETWPQGDLRCGRPGIGASGSPPAARRRFGVQIPVAVVRRLSSLGGASTNRVGGNGFDSRRRAVHWSGNLPAFMSGRGRFDSSAYSFFTILFFTDSVHRSASIRIMIENHMVGTNPSLSTVLLMFVISPFA